MRRMIVTLLSLVLLSAGYAGIADAQSFVGIIKAVEGGTTLERNGEVKAAARGMQIQKGDRVKTDPRGAIGLVFLDDTLISMGPNSEVWIDDYLFEPLEKKLSFIARILRGTVCFLSGQIAKLSPESVRLVMPEATIGVRGTHVLIKVD
ncbi:MAG: FecR domain-containing protein [Pseudomonadota bacterium]